MLAAGIFGSDKSSLRRAGLKRAASSVAKAGDRPADQEKTVLIVAPPPQSSINLETLGDGIAQIAEANGADLADGYEAFRDRAAETGGDSAAAGLVRPDDVHPSEEGQRLLAEAVTAVVED